MELNVRAVRDVPLREAVRDRSRPVIGEGEVHGDHRAVWRTTVVALALMGSAPCVENVAAANAMGETLSTAAVVLAAKVASPSHGAKIVAALSAVKADGFLTTCSTRLSRGHLVTVVG